MRRGLAIDGRVSKLLVAFLYLQKSTLINLSFLAASMETLARQIAKELEKANHYAVYDPELTRVWPNRKKREAQMILFARQHGLRLRFYKDGLCAIFDKEPSAEIQS